MKVLFLLFFLSTLAMVSLAETSLDQCIGFYHYNEARTKPWHTIDNQKKLSINLFRRFFGEKYVMRRVLEGGPIETVKPYFAMRSDSDLFAEAVERHRKLMEEKMQDLINRFGPDHASHYRFDSLKDLSVPGGIVGVDKTYSIDKLASDISTGLLDYPIVFKRNWGGIGFGVVFIEPVKAVSLEAKKDEQLKITLSIHQFGEFNWQEYLLKLGFTIDNEKDIASIYVNRKQSKSLFKEVISKVSTTDGVSVDFGMFERKVEAVKYNGKAYETRHMITANLSDKRVDLVKRHPNDSRVRWFARIGSSEEFSNFTGRELSTELPYSRMYQPLFEMFSIPFERQSAFKKYVDNLIEAEMQYLLKRYEEGGVHIPVDISGAFDLMWLPPLPNQEFPLPVIIESDVSVSFPQSHFPNGPPEFITLTPK